MVINFGISQAFFLLSSIVGFLIASILLFRKKRLSNRYNLYLGLSFLFLSLGIFIGFVFQSGLIRYLPFVLRWGNAMVLIFMPFSYLYFRSNIRNTPFQFSDSIHFLPALFYIIDFLPTFLMGHEEKSVLIDAFLSHEDQEVLHQ